MKKRHYISPSMETHIIEARQNILTSSVLTITDGKLEDLVVSEEEYDGFFQ